MHIFTGDGKTCFIKRLIGEGFDEEHNKTNALEADLKCRVNIILCKQAWKRSHGKLTELIQEDFIQGVGLGLVDTTEKAKTPPTIKDSSQRNDVVHRGRDTGNMKRKNEDILPGPPDRKQLKDDDEKILKTLHQRQKAVVKKPVEQECTIHVWDFGGDVEFYNLHQIFLRPKCVYALIVNLSRNLHDEIPSHQMPYHGTNVKMKYHQQIEFWLNMIASHAIRGNVGEGNVVLVGTHKDRLPGTPEKQQLAAQEYYKTICNLFANKEHANLVCDFYAVDSKGGDEENYAKVRRKLMDEIKKNCRWDESRPIRWLRLEKRLHELKDESDAWKVEGNVISYDKVRELGKEFNINTEKDLDFFLDFHHLTADITFCKSGDLGKYVVADPQWLIDVFRALITLDEFLPQNMKYENQKETLKEDGTVEVSSGLLQQIWAKFLKNSSSRRQNELIQHFLALMVKFDLAVEYGPDRYMIPCMLPVSPRNCRKLVKVSSLYYKFHASQVSHLKYQAGSKTNDNFLPQGLFQKLVSRCSKLSQEEPGWQWGAEKQFQNAVTFKDGDNFIYLETESTLIQLAISSPASRKVNFHEYQSKVSSEIDFLLKTYHQNMWYEFAVNPCEKDLASSHEEARVGLEDSLDPSKHARESCVVGTGLSRLKGEQKGKASVVRCPEHDTILQTDSFLGWFSEYTIVKHFKMEGT